MGMAVYATFAGILVGTGITLVGVLAVAWVRKRTTGKSAAQGKAAERLAAEVLRNLSYLTTRVAGDVQSHGSQIAEVNARLANVESGQGVIADAVQRLLDANQQMQEKLSQTENHLRNQAAQLEAQTTAARTDPLTLLSNRRALDEAIHRFASEFLAQGRGFSLLSMDVDEFKKVNDTHGHAAGDEVLRGLANVLRQSVPKHAFVARFGGEEFAILMQDTPLDEACAAANVAREAVKASSFPYNGIHLAVTASFGVAELCKGEDTAGLFQRADQALYVAKHNGRDSVCWHDGDHVCKGMPAVLQIEAPASTPQIEPPCPQSGASAASPPEASQPTVEPLGDSFGLPNRTMFCGNVRARVFEWKRGGSPFSILLLKIHPHGKPEAERARMVPPRVLQRVATLIQGVVRDMDLIGYYAQACFSLLMPGVDLLASSHIACRLEEQLLHLLKNTSGTPRMDLSIGTAVVAAGDDTVSLLRRAENALRASEPESVVSRSAAERG